MVLTELKPQSVWLFFEEITRIPRPSGQEKQLIVYITDLASKLGLDYKMDAMGNVLVTKPATPGYEHYPVVVLQSHMDMVCEKNNGVEFDFETEPLRIRIENDWVTADGTTLGADNGIGVATELALLASTDVEHGPLECLFTVDEEKGMTGAESLLPDFFTGRILLNLDSENKHQVFIGCAGGMDTVAMVPLKEEQADHALYYFTVTVNGLLGGHSGDDIHKQRANANKLLAGFLHRLTRKTTPVLCSLDGGNLRNAIPREASAVVGVPFDMKEQVRIELNHYIVDVEHQFATTDSSICFKLESEPVPATMFNLSVSAALIKALVDCPNGVVAMSREVEGLVETSTNLSSLKQKNGCLEIATMQRSSNNEALPLIAAETARALLVEDASVEHTTPYPGWQPNSQSAILDVARRTHCRLYGFEPEVLAVHAGLECGLFIEKYPYLDMISIGPDMEAIHSPDERLHIPSVTQWWEHLLLILKEVAC